MNLIKRSQDPIDSSAVSGSNSFRNSAAGSIVLEAALVMPLFLVFVILLISFIQAALADIALHKAVRETVRQVSSHAYPFQWSEREMQSAGPDSDQRIPALASLLPESAAKVFQFQVLFKGENPRQSSSEWLMIVRPVLEPIVWHYMDANYRNTLIKREQLKLVNVVLPDFSHKGDRMFGIEVEVEWPLTIPFYRKVLHIRKHFYERVWTGA
ncbi:TadE family protein [Ferviditalea candida]|uniref:TadE family protein n=1 Tax=Ferviditalea candida TaxID=3108399 RepID=A0ABU5ZJJ5_9BACL|nr:TadE family protein [Paenibacillaceae bacterium T2]